MLLQITELRNPPDPKLMNPVRNPPVYRHGDIRQWLVDHYRGNKPTGGLWTSTYTPDDEYTCDWQRGRSTNSLIQLAYPNQDGLAVYRLVPKVDAIVLEIESAAAALEFTRSYHLSTAPIPATLGPMRVALTTEITDWQLVGRRYDGIHLTAEAADEIAYEAINSGSDTAFHTWNCESTFWFRWSFEHATSEEITR